MGQTEILSFDIFYLNDLFHRNDKHC